MKLRSSYFLFPILFLLMAGCADVEKDTSHAGPDRPQPGKALAIFYRPGRYVGCMRGLEVSDRQTPVGDLSNGSYFVYQASPGEHLFNLNGHDEDAVVGHLAPNHIYHYRCTIEMGAWSPHYHVDEVSADTAAGEMQGLNRVRWLGH